MQRALIKIDRTRVKDPFPLKEARDRGLRTTPGCNNPAPHRRPLFGPNALSPQFVIPVVRESLSN